MIKGQVISGQFGSILVREKAGEKIEIGELLVADTKDAKIILQVYDLQYGSQISQGNLELISGMNLEDGTDLDFMDRKLRNYNIALLKNLIAIRKKDAAASKTLPDFFAEVKEITKDDLKFLTTPESKLSVGNLRSGSKMLDFPIFLDGEKALSHHILIPATTGRGKSNLTSTMLWNLVDKDYCGILVLDPHDEYYGRTGIGLKDHPEKDDVVYYTTRDPPAGALTLKINLKNIKPGHFNGVVDWSDPQKEALNAFYRKYNGEWINAILTDKEIEGFHEGTINVVKRRMIGILNISVQEGECVCRGVFDDKAGESTISDIRASLEDGKIVIIDTSCFSGNVEILIGSLVATEVLNKYRNYKTAGELKGMPVINIVLEEAPRVLGKEVLEKGPNIFSTIAREGRKFKVGLTAITQLPSLIPRQILANMNTKIILGIEMKPERQAIIESSAQDLSEDDRNIASLDIGEAIISSNFSKFATPIKIPYFEDLVKESQSKNSTKKSFDGVTLNQ